MGHDIGHTAVYRREDLLYRKYIARFVVDIHHAYKAGMLIAGTYEVRRIEPSVLTGRHPYHLKALSLKVCGSLLHRGVFDCGNDYLFPFSAVSCGSSAECKIVALGSSRCEVYTAAVRAYGVGYGLSCAVHKELRFETCAVERRWITIFLCHCGHCCRHCFLAGLGGRRIIKVNFHYMFPFYQYSSIPYIITYYYKKGKGRGEKASAASFPPRNSRRGLPAYNILL